MSGSGVASASGLVDRIVVLTPRSWLAGAFCDEQDFSGKRAGFWWNPIILLTGGLSLRYVSGFEMVSVDVREVIVAGWWRGWELCSELGSFGSTEIVKIWYEIDGVESVIYENALGEDNDGTTEIGGGSIVIHNG